MCLNSAAYGVRSTAIFFRGAPYAYSLPRGLK